jgi:hypothetical protein
MCQTLAISEIVFVLHVKVDNFIILRIDEKPADRKIEGEFEDLNEWTRNLICLPDSPVFSQRYFDYSIFKSTPHSKESLSTRK